MVFLVFLPMLPAFPRAEPDPFAFAYTFVSPTPADSDLFGVSVAVHNDMILIAEPLDDTAGQDAGAAHLFDRATGELVHTFLEVDGLVAIADNILAVAGQRAVHLFDANTFELAHTITDPTPSVEFASSLAITEKYVVVGDRSDNVNGAYSGAVHVFNASTAELINTFHDPTPGLSEYFGVAVAIRDTRVFISAAEGDLEGSSVVYMFDAVTGELLRTLRHPDAALSTNFGHSLAATGDLVLVGAPYDRTVGAAHLFEASSGNLVHTFLDPTPTPGEEFGFAVAIFDDKVLVGASFDPVGPEPGEAYVFHKDGELLQTFLDPTPGDGQQFGWSVAGEDGSILIGSRFDDVSGKRSGAAYLFKAAPVADFTFSPSAPEVGEAIIFDASDSYDPDGGTIAGYLWFFGDGHFSTTGPVVSHAYATAGAYFVMLTVRDDEDVSTSTAGTVTVGPTTIVRTPGVHVGDWARYSFEAKHPDVDDITGFLFNVQDVTGSNVTLMVTVTFRDGTDSTMESELDVTKLYSAGFVLIGSGLSAGDQIYADAAFKINATASEPVLGANREVSVLNVTQTIPGSATTFTQVKWDRTSGVLVYQNMTATAGSTESTVIAMVETNIWGVNQPPVASFSSSPGDPLPGQTVNFDAGESSDPDGEITDYSWDFGDGGTATGVAVSHSYSSAGTFTIRLTVTDDQDATHTVSRTIAVSAQTGILRIIVRDQAGNLLSGVVVRITSGPVQPGELRTGSDGSATFENLPVGQYGFEVAGTGFLTLIDSATVLAGQQPVERTVNLSPAQQGPSIPSSDGVYVGVAAAVVVILGGVLVYVWGTRAKKARSIKAA